jgi:hypothetical protein
MSYFPRGAIALVEPGHAHKKFLHKAEPRYALIKYHHANRLLKAGETADSWFPDATQVITTTSVIDHRNVTIPLEHNGHRRGEVDIVREFGPDYHIPADRADYIDFPDELRYEKTKECMTGTMAMANHIAAADLDTQIIPWIKTATPKERQLCYRTAEQLGLDFAAIYCNPYFNGSGGIQIADLIDDLEMITTESATAGEDDSPLNLLTISCLSPNVLSRVPDSVVAATGQMVGTDRGWRNSITPTKQTETEVKEIYADVEVRVANALGVSDSVDLSRYGALNENPLAQTDNPAKRDYTTSPTLF